MQLKAVIFDMDGVIIDSEPLWREAEILVFGNYGITLTEDMCRSTAGLRLVQVVEHWQKKFNFTEVVKEKLIHEVHEKVIELIREKGNALPGLYPLLNYFSSKNYLIALASGSSYAIIHNVLGKLDIASYFKVLRSGDDERFGKPHPSIFIETASQLNVPYDDCLVIEDSGNGVIAALAARMHVIAIPEHEVENKPVFSLAKAKVKTLEEIITYLEQSK